MIFFRFVYLSIEQNFLVFVVHLNFLLRRVQITINSSLLFARSCEKSKSIQFSPSVRKMHSPPTPASSTPFSLSFSSCVNTISLSLSLALSFSLSHLAFLHAIFFLSVSPAYLSYKLSFYLSIFMYSFTNWTCRISFVVAMFLLLRVASVYGYGRRTGSKPVVQGVSAQICFIIKPGVAASGAALALISVLLGIVYFHTVERLMKETETQEEQFTQEIPMAQAQLPPEPPVFVHEDTYNRRQMP